MLWINIIFETFQRSLLSSTSENKSDASSNQALITYKTHPLEKFIPVRPTVRSFDLSVYLFIFFPLLTRVATWIWTMADWPDRLVFQVFTESSMLTGGLISSVVCQTQTRSLFSNQALSARVQTTVAVIMPNCSRTTPTFSFISHSSFKKKKTQTEKKNPYIFCRGDKGLNNSARRQRKVLISDVFWNKWLLVFFQKRSRVRT